MQGARDLTRARRVEIECVEPIFHPGLFASSGPLIRESPEVMYHSERDLVNDHSKFDRAFGATFTPHREVIQRTVEWYRANGG